MRCAIDNSRGFDSGLHGVGQGHHSARSKQNDTRAVIFWVGFDPGQANEEQSALLLQACIIFGFG
jgi:hypothetical protein